MICLVNMPFVALRKQSLGLPLVSGILKGAGMDVTTLYLNFDLAGMMGFMEYMHFTDAEEIPTYFLQWLFAGLAWGWDKSREETALDGLLEYCGASNAGTDVADRLRTLRWNVLPRFMENCVEKVRGMSDLEVVGFSCMFQHLPSLALGRMLRQALPDVKLIYGGSVFHEDAGEEIFDRTEWIDALSNSEADDVIAEAFRRLLNGRPLDGLQGMMYRDRGTGKIYKTPGAPVAGDAIDNGVIPDMDGYFEAACSHGLMPYFTKKLIPVSIPFESSRGCWWHEKSPCTFCGLNGLRDTYRVKSPENVLKVLRHYHEKFGADTFEAVDNNLSMDYFDTFLPHLREVFPEGVSVYYNVKVNMSRTQIRALANSGITLALAGIENLSDHALKLMNKGATAIQNVFFLKCARQYGIFLLWNMMLGAFGETQDDCDEIAALVPKILHLCPPVDPYRMTQVHRFSRYWKTPALWFDKIKPAGWYRHIFPEDFDLDKIAYYFDVRPCAEFAAPMNYDGVNFAVTEWRRRWMFDDEPKFFYREEDRHTVLYDLRQERPVKIVLSALEASVWHLLDDVIPGRVVLDKTADLCEPEETERILDEFTAHGFAMRSGNLYLGLALREGFRAFRHEEKISVIPTREAKPK